MASNRFVDQNGRMREGNGQWAEDPSRGAAAYDLTGPALDEAAGDLHAENIGAEHGDPCDRCGRRTGNVQAYGPAGANHWCGSCVEERRMDEMREDPDAYARNFALNTTGSYPSDDAPRLSGSRERAGVRKPAAERDGKQFEPKYIETSDGRTFGPFADTKAVEQFVASNHIQLDLDEFNIVDGPTEPNPAPARPKVQVARIDKREARKRWERGLPVAVATSRTYFNEDRVMDEGHFATALDNPDLSLDLAYPGAQSFAKPVVKGSIYDTCVEVDPSQIKPGDRIDADAVGNWKVLSAETSAEGVTTLTMPLGNSHDPGTRLRFLPGPGVVEYVGQDGAVFKTLPQTNVTRREPQTDPNVIRETIARDFPNATFGPDGTHAVIDGQIQRLRPRPADASARTVDDYSPQTGATQAWVDQVNAEAAAKAAARQAEWDAQQEQITVRWTPNTTAEDLVRPARRRR